jgi:hypothetical protein
MRAHLHHREFKAIDFDDSPHLIATSTAILIGAAVASAAAIGSSMYAAQAEKTAQKKAVAHQEDKANQLEAKIATAEVVATQAAKDKVVAKRRAVTQTILTSPLGVMEDSSSGLQRPTLLGGA